MLQTRIAHVSTARGIPLRRFPDRRPFQRFPTLHLFKAHASYHSLSEKQARANIARLYSIDGKADGQAPLDTTGFLRRWVEVMQKQPNGKLSHGKPFGLALDSDIPSIETCSSQNAGSTREDLSWRSITNILTNSSVPGPWDLLEAQTQKNHNTEITLTAYLLSTTKIRRQRAAEVLLLSSAEDTETWATAMKVNDQVVPHLLQNWSTVPGTLKEGIWRAFIRNLLLYQPERLCRVLSETWLPIYASDYQLESVIRYLYYHYLMGNHFSSASMNPFYETLIDLASRVKDPSGLFAFLPRYFLIRKCPEHLQRQLQALLEKHTPKIHWEHHLHSACMFAECGNAESAIAAVWHAIAADADTSSVEFFNAATSILTPSNPYGDDREAAYIIPTLLRKLPKPKMVHPLVYSRMAEKGLELGDTSTLLEIFRFHKRHGIRIYPRTRTLLLRGMENCDNEDVLRLITKNTKMHCLRSHNPIIGTHAIFCWMLYHSRHGSTSLYNEILPHYLQIFDPRALEELGLPTLVANQPIPTRKRMEPNASVLSMILHAYFTDNSNDANYVRSTYNRFQKAIENRSRSILLALRGTPSVYTVFLLAISRLEGTKHLQECMTVMADLSAELTPNTLPLDPETGVPMKVAGPNLRTWNVLLRAFGHHRQFAAAEKVLAEIRQRWGPEGAQVGAHTLMSAYAGVQNVQGAMDIFRQLMKENLQVPEHSLKALGRLNNRDDLERIWAEEEKWDDSEDEIPGG